MKQDINVKWVQITMVSSSINYPFIYLFPARFFSAPPSSSFANEGNVSAEKKSVWKNVRNVIYMCKREQMRMISS